MDREAQIHAALERHFGFGEFRPGQYAPVEAILEGRDAVVVMPTGSGKSLCYQLAAVMLPGTTLVVSPLIALMRDQVARLERKGVAATFVNSTLAPAEAETRLARMAAGAYKLVYIAPERFRNAHFLETVARTNLGLLTVDEAHCISQWGHDFRPDYLNIREALKGFADIPVMAVTATATPDVRGDIVRQLRLGEAPRKAPFVQVQGFGRDNLHLAVRAAAGADEKFVRLLELARKWKTGIVYAATRRCADDVHRRLEDEARAGRLGESKPLLYHAGLDDDERERVYREFVEAKHPVVVATTAFGMGVDRADVRFVAHWDLPGSVEAYYQEVGRAGRDGLPSRCELFFGWNAVRTQEYFIAGANPHWPLAKALLGRLEAMEGREGPIDGREIARELGENPIAVETALKLLQRDGTLRLSGGQGLFRAGLCGAVDWTRLEALFEGRREKERRDRKRLRDMIGFCETPGCRHRYILDYFGEETPAGIEVCGGCDRCGERKPPPPLGEDQWIAVQKALSCIGRLKGRWGAEVVADVLLGTDGKAVREGRLKESSTWGLLRGWPRGWLLALLETLVRSGCAAVAVEGPETIRLTPKGFRVARREEPEFTLRWPAEPGKKPRKTKPVERQGRTAGKEPGERARTRPRKPGDGSAEGLDAASRRRATALREWRKNTAKSMGWAAFRLMSNRTLEAVARSNPRTFAELAPLLPGELFCEFAAEILAALARAP